MLGVLIDIEVKAKACVWLSTTQTNRKNIIRELGNNQIKELPPGVFNNNTEFTVLYVIDFPGSCDDSLWCAKSFISLSTKCDQEGPEA